jgi:thymidylate synthase ThyX
MNWLSKRLHKSAQWEHRQYALAVKQLYQAAMPTTAAAFEEYILDPLT